MVEKYIIAEIINNKINYKNNLYEIKNFRFFSRFQKK
jgi:hypothetical protein